MTFSSSTWVNSFHLDSRSPSSSTLSSCWFWACSLKKVHWNVNMCSRWKHTLPSATSGIWCSLVRATLAKDGHVCLLIYLVAIGVCVTGYALLPTASIYHSARNHWQSGKRQLHHTICDSVQGVAKEEVGNNRQNQSQTQTFHNTLTKWFDNRTEAEREVFQE